MNGWLNWREIEKNNDWGVRDKDDATADMWNAGAAGWEERAIREEDFNRRQVEALDLDPEDHVVDVCCGPGPLTVWIAPRVKQVTAYDYGENMLAYVKEKAEKKGLLNIDYLQGNFYTMEPGTDAPVFDVAVTRHSPAQGDILRFSRWAKKRCYSLCNVYPARRPDSRSTLWIKSAKAGGGQLNYSSRPDGRLYGVNVHFNLLYDMGADPELKYVIDVMHVVRADVEEIYRERLRGRPFSKEEFDYWRERMAGQLERKDGGWVYTEQTKMSILSWDPSAIRY